jgi:hypothetical protein
VTCEAEFMGSPAHSTLLAFPGEEPPPHWDVAVAWGAIVRGDHLSPLEIVHFRYRREVSHLDDGPLWVFVPDQEYEDPPKDS